MAPRPLAGAELAGSLEAVVNGMDLTRAMTIITWTGSGEVQARRAFTTDRKNAFMVQSANYLVHYRSHICS